MSNTRSHVYTFGAGAEVPEIKYSGEGIYRSSPPPSMEDRDSFIDPQRPCGSSRLDYIMFQCKAMLYDNYLNTYILYSFNCSPIQFQALPNCDRNTELPSARGGNMTEMIVPGIKGGICGRTPQSFTIDCSSSGETPETVAVVRPDGELSTK